MNTKEKKRLFKLAAYKKANDVHFQCQCCGKLISITNNWYYDSYYFDHVRNRRKLTDEQYVNYFLVVCKSLHKYHHDSPPNLKSDSCVKLFLSKYENNDMGGFYSNFIAAKGHEELLLNV